MLNHKYHGYQPVGFIDEDSRKHQLRRMGLHVFGDQSCIDDLCTQHAEGNLLIAIAGITVSQRLELDQRLHPLGAQVTIIPTASQIVGGAVRLGNVSDVTEEDLVWRRPIETDEEEITKFIQFKRILIAGAGGSIGSDLSRQLNHYRPAELFLIDRDE